MSSPPPSPYKSRLFNFFNRNYIKFQSKVNIKIREFGYVLQSGLQALVLPLFWLWETSKKISKSFTGSNPSNPVLSSGDNEVNISPQNDLILAVNEAINLHPKLPSLPSKKFQGLASRLPDKKIIFVLENNKFKDIIPLSQQSEVNFLIQTITDDFLLPQLPPSSPNIIPQLLSHLNFFGKAKSKTKIEQDLQNLQHSELTIVSNNPNSFFIFLDNFLANLENLRLKNKEGNLADNSQEDISFLMLIKSAIDYFFNLSHKENILPEKEDENNSLSLQNLLRRSPKSAENIIPQIQDTAGQLINQGINQINVARNNINNQLNNPEDPFQIKVLIWAAINYFFSQKNSSNNLSNKQKKSFLSSFSDTEIIINDEGEDPWLSWDDLYNNSSQELEPSINLVNNQIIVQENINNIINTNQSNASENISTLTNNKKQENQIINTEKKETKLTKKQIIIEEEIETKVIEISYEKHFLEFILEQLDRLILWIEEMLIKIINYISKTLKR